MVLRKYLSQYLDIFEPTELGKFIGDWKKQ